MASFDSHDNVMNALQPDTQEHANLLNNEQAPNSAASLLPSTPVSVDVFLSEILIKIFSYIPELSPPHSAATRAPAWVAILHVCHQWREVAFACSTLWTTIPLGRPEWTDIALERSQGYPLTIHMVRDLQEDWRVHKDKRARNALNNLYRALTRVHSAILRGPIIDNAPATKNSSFFSDIPNEIASSRAVSLECTGQTVVGPSYTSYNATPTHLARLSLRGCIVSAGSEILRAPLSSLTIRPCTVLHGIATVLVLLGSFPALEHLAINDIVLSEEGRPYTGPVVNLPHLKHLEVNVSSKYLKEIVASLSFPTDADTVLGCQCTDLAEATDTITSLRETLAHHLCHDITHVLNPETDINSASIVLHPAWRGDLFSSLPDAQTLPPQGTSHLISRLRIDIHWVRVAVTALSLLALLVAPDSRGCLTHLGITSKRPSFCAPAGWHRISTRSPHARRSPSLRALASPTTAVRRFLDCGGSTSGKVAISKPPRADVFERLMEVVEDTGRRGREGEGEGLNIALTKCRFAPGMKERLEKYVKLRRVTLVDC
ncbi:hypothetical protein OF83DRAFT_1138778 [Amylostereum chailletii]|nr:hypothetical protein OF83DRAFT_1138778 [Amylostereum chailletii]